MDSTRQVFAAVSLVAAILLAILVSGSADPVSRGADAGFTYGYLPSLARANVDFTDDAIPFDSAMPHTRTGRTHNAFPVGPALWWAPTFLVADAGALIARAATDDLPRADGRSWPYGVLVGLGALTVGVVGVTLTVAAGRRVASPRAAVLAAALVWLAGPAIYYTHIEPTVSHASGFASVALLLAGWLWMRDRPTTAWHQVVLGLLVAFAALCRWQNVIFAIGPIIDVATGRVGGRGKVDPAGLVRLGSAAVVGFAPQLAIWSVLYGSPLRPPRGETSGAYLAAGTSHVLDVLFSWRHGAFSWHPILAIGLAGLVAMAISGRAHRSVAWSLLASIGVTVVVNAAVLDWWAGASFGARRFDGAWPAFALGLAYLVDRVRPWLSFLVGGFAFAANWLLLGGYVEGAVDRIGPVTPNAVASAVRLSWLLPNASSWSSRKALWIAGLVVLAAGVAWLGRGGRSLPRPSLRWVAAAGFAVAVACSVLVVVAGARHPGRFDAHVFEANYFVPQPTRPQHTDRIVRPGEEPWTLVWSMPGFLPDGAYRVSVDAHALESTSTRVIVELDGEVVVEGDVGATFEILQGSTVSTGVGFLRLEVRVSGAPARIGAVRLDPVR